MRKLGIFVMRPHAPQRTLDFFASGALEVLRYGPNWHVRMEAYGQAWFFHCIGSGVCLNTSGLVLENVFYRTYNSAPREEVVIRSDLLGFWSADLRFFLYGGQRCSFPTDDKVLHCLEQNTTLYGENTALCDEAGSRTIYVAIGPVFGSIVCGMLWIRYNCILRLMTDSGWSYTRAICRAAPPL